MIKKGQSLSKRKNKDIQKMAIHINQEHKKPTATTLTLSGKLFQLARQKFENQKEEVDFCYWLREQLKERLEKLK